MGTYELTKLYRLIQSKIKLKRLSPLLTNTVNDVGNRGVEAEKTAKSPQPDEKLTDEDEHYRRMIDMVIFTFLQHWLVQRRIAEFLTKL